MSAKPTPGVSPAISVPSRRCEYRAGASEGSETRAEINNIEGFGEVVAEAIADFFAERHNEDVLDALLEHVTPLPMEASLRRARSRARRLSLLGRSNG